MLNQIAESKQTEAKAPILHSFSAPDPPLPQAAQSKSPVWDSVDIAGPGGGKLGLHGNWHKSNCD